MKKCPSAAAAVGGRRRTHHGRTLTVSSVVSTSAARSTLPPLTQSPRTGHASRRSTGGDGFGFGGDDGGRRQNRRPGSDVSMSSSLSPVRQVKRGGGGGGGDQPFRTIGGRAVSDRRFELAAESSAVPESLAYGGRGAEGDEDTTAAKLKRLHSLSAGFDAAPAPPTLAATVRSRSDGHAIQRVSPQRHTASAATPIKSGLLNPPLSAPKRASVLNSASEGGVGRQPRQQREKKPRAVRATPEEISTKPRVKRGGSRRRRGGNSAEEDVHARVSEMKLL